MPTTDMPSIVIRPATAADMRAVGRLGALLVREHHDFDPLRFIAATPNTEQGYGAYLESQLGEAQVVILVAADADAVVGYTYAGLEGMDYMSLRGPAGALYDIVVDPDYRARGVGRLLLDATIMSLQTLGAPRIVLSTAEQNTSAQRLFARAGFRRTMIEMTREADPER
jgi:ribosomal protein S18 acetylase RimI-like enzyme